MLYRGEVQAAVNPARILRWLIAFACGAFGAFLTLELLTLSPAPEPLALPPDFGQTLVGSAAWLCFAITLAVNLLDVLRGMVRRRFVNGLDSLVKDIGQFISSGHGIESAVHQATHARGGRPARMFIRILHDQSGTFFEENLHKAALASSHAGFQEAALLLEQSVRAGGDAGTRVQETGEVLSQVRAMQERFEASTTFGVGLIRVLGLLIVPTLFSALATAFEFSIAPHATLYFAAMATGVALLEWRVSGDFARGLMRWPLYATVVTYLLCTVGEFIAGSSPTGFTL